MTHTVCTVLRLPRHISCILLHSHCQLPLQNLLCKEPYLAQNRTSSLLSLPMHLYHHPYLRRRRIFYPHTVCSIQPLQTPDHHLKKTKHGLETLYRYHPRRDMMERAHLDQHLWLEGRIKRRVVRDDKAESPECKPSQRSMHICDRRHDAIPTLTH